jgi:hypothetical protein
LGAAGAVHRYGSVREASGKQVAALVVAPEKTQVERGMGIGTRRSKWRTGHYEIHALRELGSNNPSLNISEIG